MRPRSSIKPLELVVSAIHCLREKKGSSPQNILRYLVGKYNVDTEILKPHIQTGLRRGLNFGMITQQSGLFRLNDILKTPLNLPVGKAETTNTKRKSERTKPQRNAERTNSQKSAPNKCNRPIKKRALKPYIGKRKVCVQKNKGKARKYKERKKRTVKSTRRYQTELRQRKQRQRKNGKSKTLKQKIRRGKRIKGTENQLTAGAEDQKQNAEGSKEETKDNAKP